MAQSREELVASQYQRIIEERGFKDLFGAYQWQWVASKSYFENMEDLRNNKQNNCIIFDDSIVSLFHTLQKLANYYIEQNRDVPSEINQASEAISDDAPEYMEKVFKALTGKAPEASANFKNWQSSTIARNESSDAQERIKKIQLMVFLPAAFGISAGSLTMLATIGMISSGGAGFIAFMVGLGVLGAGLIAAKIARHFVDKADDIIKKANTIDSPNSIAKQIAKKFANKSPQELAQNISEVNNIQPQLEPEAYLSTNSSAVVVAGRNCRGEPVAASSSRSPNHGQTQSPQRTIANLF